MSDGNGDAGILKAVKHPDVTIQLAPDDNNPDAILRRAVEAMRRAGLGDEVNAFVIDATSADLDHLLQTVRETLDTTEPRTDNVIELGEWVADRAGRLCAGCKLPIARPLPPPEPDGYMRRCPICGVNLGRPVHPGGM